MMRELTESFLRAHGSSDTSHSYKATNGSAPKVARTHSLPNLAALHLSGSWARAIHFVRTIVQAAVNAWRKLSKPSCSPGGTAGS
jgi:hypothetical protein